MWYGLFQQHDIITLFKYFGRAINTQLDIDNIDKQILNDYELFLMMTESNNFFMCRW